MNAKRKSSMDIETFENLADSAPDYPAGVEERIRIRAYELYEQRGYVSGRDLDDWLAAERIVRQTIPGPGRVDRPTARWTSRRRRACHGCTSRAPLPCDVPHDHPSSTGRIPLRPTGLP